MEQRINDFREFAKLTIEQNEPQADQNLTKGTVGRMMSYATDLGEKLEKTLSTLSAEVEKIVSETEEAQKTFVSGKLLSIIPEAKNDFIRKYKPR
ncbi:MAG: hypothetical protein JWQ09_2991 [Segetibacter sp.]|nr:hypothetical protein [Segetibacter sp.]